MPQQPPALIDDMKPLYYAKLDPYKAHLKKYMQAVPAFFVVVYYAEDGSYCIIGTDDGFANWENYTNYVFKDVQPALELPHVIFRIDGFDWIKIPQATG